MVRSPAYGASELQALCAQLGDDLVDALLLEGTHAAGREPQPHPALLGLEPEALRVQVRQEATALLVVGVRDAVTDGRLLASDFADAGHSCNLERNQRLRSLAGRTGVNSGPGFIPARRRDLKPRGAEERTRSPRSAYGVPPAMTGRITSGARPRRQ